MARRVKAHSENLERLVAERTQALEEAHLSLTDSIDYARLIQNAILPDRHWPNEMAGDTSCCGCHAMWWAAIFYFYDGNAARQAVRGD
jgi:phosphoserine phosphatase RsbU/P